MSLLASDLLQHGSLLFSLFAFYDGLHKTTLIHGKFECTCFQISINLPIFGKIADFWTLMPNAFLEMRHPILAKVR